MNHHHYVVIMAGGIGSRFWPVSRMDYPKQFLDILGTGQSLIQQTFRRFEKLVPAENIYVVTSDSYEEIVAEQLPLIPRQNILGEPQRRNTAPCIIYIANKLIKIDPQAALVVAPSDHLILEEDQFVDTCRSALYFAARKNALVTLGIKPSYPNTGYGYIGFQKIRLHSGRYQRRFAHLPKGQGTTDQGICIEGKERKRKPVPVHAIVSIHVRKRPWTGVLNVERGKMQQTVLCYL